MAGITLGQYAQLETDVTKKYIELNILRDCKFMETLPFDTVSALRVNAVRWTQLPTGGAWRSVNEGYASSEDGQLGDSWEALYGFGSDMTWDTVIDRLSNTIKDPRQVQIEGKLKSMSLQWNYALINGDPASDPKQFSGLKKRVASMPASQSIYFTAGTTDAPLDVTASSANALKFINKIDQGWKYCNDGNVSAILCNLDFVLGFTRALRYLQTAGNFMDTTQDSIGRKVVTYMGVPFVDMGFTSNLSTEVIPTTEVAGDGGADSMSVYLVSCNTNDGVYGIQLNNLQAYDPLNGGEMESKPSKMLRIDWWNGLASFGSRGIVRLRNLSNLAGWTV